MGMFGIYRTRFTALLPGSPMLVESSCDTFTPKSVMDRFLKDLKHSCRMFLRSPGFNIPAVVALALGIAANTAIFSVVNTVLLKPFAYRDAARIVMFQSTFRRAPGPEALHRRNSTGGGNRLRLSKMFRLTLSTSPT